MEDHSRLFIYVQAPSFSKLRKGYDNFINNININGRKQESLVNPNNKQNFLYPESFSRTKFLNDSDPSVKPKRNLIIFSMESVEKQSLGMFNKFMPGIAPFLCNFSQQGTFFARSVPQAYSVWTAGSIFTTHCGLPHVISDMAWSAMKDSLISKWPQIPCMAKHFQDVGYNLYFSSSGIIYLMGVLDFFKQAGFHADDADTNKFPHDYDFYAYVIERLFKVKIEDHTRVQNSLYDSPIKEPFVYIINNEDTHPSYYTDKKCAKNPKFKRIQNSLNCFDFSMKRFFSYFEKSEIFNRTDVFMYGDHPSYGNPSGLFTNPRELLMFFPYLEKRIIRKEVTLYDIAPTLLDMMGIEYYPPYPYGSNMFDEKWQGSYPVNNEFNYIYNMILEKNNKKGLSCSEKGICGDTWQYFKTRISTKRK